MTGADLPAAVRRWVRRPLWIGVPALLLAAGLFVDDVLAARDDERTFEDAHRVTAEIDAGWDGGSGIDLSYRHPETGERVHASTDVWQVDLPERDATSVVIEVARDDQTAVVLAGDRFPVTGNLANYAPWTLLPFVVWGVRQLTIRRSVRLVGGPGVSFAMQARAEAPTGLRRRWRLHLYPLDVDARDRDERPVCTVPLIAPPPPLDAFPVEVKGSPRPFGRVVARVGGGGGDGDDDGVLWASGRALGFTRGRSRVERSTRIAGAVAVAGVGALMTIGGFAWFVADSEALDVQDRSETVPATVTRRIEREGGQLDLAVAYEWEGRQRRGTLVDAPEAREGERLAIRIDPLDPDRIWSAADDLPPGGSSGDVPFAVFLVGAPLAVGGAIAAVRTAVSRPDPAGGGDGRGLRIADGALWLGDPHAGLGDPSVRFDPDGLTVVEHDGRHALLAWDDHAAASSHRVPPWWLEGWAWPRPPRGDVIFVVATAQGTLWRRIAGSGWPPTAWVGLPALAAYLAATPDARAGLADPLRLASLLQRIAGGADVHAFDALLPDRR